MANRSSSSRQARPGDDTIGNFIVDQEIGKGSFAQVYSGRHKITGALVAIKSVELARLNKKLKENLYGEIKILKDLRHPHIVALHDCVESSTHINLIMEYCELGDLSLFIKKREKLITNPATHDLARKYPNAPGSGLNEVVIRHFLKQLASALKFLREGNFVHRDVKPQNLLLLPSPLFRQSSRTVKHILSASNDSLTPAAGLPSLPMLKLADFGFARVLPSTSLAETLCGSPLYMAPEILRYERYDAKADLWSVGTVLFEMVTGKPPFRASNHVELLRRIEAADDVIKFPKESILSSDLKHLIRALLKRLPVERVSFENFFANRVVTEPIPGLVEDDVPKEEPPISRDLRAIKTDEPLPPSRRHSFRRYGPDQDASQASQPGSAKPLRSSPLATPIEAKPNPLEQPATTGRMSYSPRQETAEGLGIRRPVPQSSTSAPTRPMMYTERRRGLSNASTRTPIRENPSPASSQHADGGRYRRPGERRAADEQERAAQDVAFERDYVVVEKRQVEVNAFADQMALYPQQATSPKSGAIVRRATQQGAPTSTTGAVPSPPSRNLQIAPGRADHYRQGSYDRTIAGSPSSTTSAISKAIQDASLRLFGFRYTPPLLGRGHSPPQMYSAFPAYPTPSAPAGLIGDGKQSGLVGEDSRVAQRIEDYATRSDVVYGFAEVKYKQLVPLAPSMEHGLGGISAEKLDEEDDEGLTVEAVVSLSEEALVLYVKSLSLLAKSMDIASLWWSRKSRAESNNSGPSSTRESAHIQTLTLRINSAVQWIRSRFNEVLEKAEIVKLKLVEAQKKLPEDHPSHPSNNQVDSIAMGASSAAGPILSEGLSAEKLMYERALEMARTAAINEVANEDLRGCELSYNTAIRMLEAVLDNDDDLPKRRISGSARDERAVQESSPTDINQDDQQSVHKVIQMLTGRLGLVRKKIHIIEAASKAQEQQQHHSMARRRSGDVTPRSVPASSS
ncbi:Serine/threonine-protein kinase ATG1 [Thozetella sp. PMI_491]|nr:Serine/threonine-protein kinase ATG1 [Thozetella sp. PMI_491]